MGSLTVRKAESSELKGIVKMHLSLQEQLQNSNSSLWKYTESKKRLLERQYAKHLVDENSLVLVAEVEAKVLGFLLATVSARTEYVPSNIGSLSSIFIEENSRRRGIGSRLIREACRFFSAKKAENIYVRYVMGYKEGNGFWKHLGFKTIIITAGTLTSKIKEQINSQ